MARLFGSEFRPGDIISANLINTIMRAIETLDDRVTAIQGSTSGEGPAVGPFGFGVPTSPRGVNVVPGEVTPYPHDFPLRNGTDKRLVIALSAFVNASTGSWGNSARLQDTLGREINSLTLEPGMEGVVRVQVTAPSNSRVGETARITLQAQVPPPTNRNSVATLDLTVASSAGTPVTSRVVFDGNAQRPPQMTTPPDAPANTVLSYLFNLLYTAPSGPQTANFKITVKITSASMSEWRGAFAGIVTTPGPSGSGEFSRTLTLNAGVPLPSPVELQIRTPSQGASDKSASFTIKIESTDLPVQISAISEERFDIRVRGTAP